MTYKMSKYVIFGIVSIIYANHNNVSGEEITSCQSASLALNDGLDINVDRMAKTCPGPFKNLKKDADFNFSYESWIRVSQYGFTFGRCAENFSTDMLNVQWGADMNSPVKGGDSSKTYITVKDSNCHNVKENLVYNYVNTRSKLYRAPANYWLPVSFEDNFPVSFEDNNVQADQPTGQKSDKIADTSQISPDNDNNSDAKQLETFHRLAILTEPNQMKSAITISTVLTSTISVVAPDRPIYRYSFRILADNVDDAKKITDLGINVSSDSSFLEDTVIAKYQSSNRQSDGHVATVSYIPDDRAPSEQVKYVFDKPIAHRSNISLTDKYGRWLATMPFAYYQPLPK